MQITPKSVPNWVYGLVTSKLATFYEIKYLMSIWDVLDLIEILVVQSSNQQICLDNRK